MPPNAPAKDILMEQNMDTLPILVAPQADDRKLKISYITVAIMVFQHLSALYGLYLCFTSAHWATVILAILFIEAGMLGCMAGTHRLWAHRSYKAKLPLHIILMVFHSLANQFTAYNWVRDHRLHHKYSDTDGDPHNSTRGFFYSHVGWFMVHKHPEVKRRGASIDMSDVLENPVLAFQKRYGLPFITFITLVLPVSCPMFFWGESFTNAWHLNILRYILTLNFVSLINSAGHAFGNRPYDKRVKGTENIAVNLATLGEGFHNYHHVFPWDYRAAELGFSKFNMTAKFIEFFAWVGWAYDLKTVDHDMARRRAKRKGDGSYYKECGDNVVEN